MSEITLSVVAEEHGDPSRVLRVVERRLPPPGPGEVLIRTLLSPIHPSDLNMVEARYSDQPTPPFVPGREGVGEVVVAGPGCTLAPGARVLSAVRPPTCPNGWWTTHRVAPEAELVAVPDDMSNEVAALLTINPPTAALMLEEHVARVPTTHKAWVLQNAGTSDVGRMVVQIARARGIRTATLISSSSTAADSALLHELGADVVLTDPLDREALRLAVRATGGEPLRVAFNGISDASVATMARCLEEDGEVVTYGGMARTPVKVPVSLLVYGGIRFSGFMRTRWIKKHGDAAFRRVLADVMALAQRPGLRVFVDDVFEVADAMSAIARAGERGRRGKVLVGDRRALTEKCSVAMRPGGGDRA